MKTPLSVSIHTSDEALQLWIAFFKAVDKAFYDSDYGEQYCFFCGEFQITKDNSLHTDNCVYVRAKAMLEKMVNL